MADDLSDLPALRVYELARHLAEETKKPLVAWLHFMASDTTTDVNATGCALILRPNDKWGFVEYVRVNDTYTPRGFVHSWHSDPPVLHRSLLNPRHVAWTFEQSALYWFRTPPTSTDEPPHLKKRLDGEGITINREDFRVWCLAAGHDLPRFWFGGQETADATNAGAALANARHGKKRPPSSAVELVVKQITDKEKRGEYWHQGTEVDGWLSNNPKSEVSRKLFIAAVKGALPDGIKAKGHAPRKTPRKR